MIRLKNERQIAGIRESCRLLCAMFREMIPLVKPGVETLEIDRWVRNWIGKAGGKPAFFNYGPRDNPFPGAICISVNEEVIHGIPGRRKIKSGDLVSLDCGIDLGGFISDKSCTVEVGSVSPEAHTLNVVTRECLYRGIAAVKAGDRLLQIARAVQGHALTHGYGVVRQFCGHGVGLAVHEDPQVPNVPHGPNPRMSAGMVIAIEPMINQGTGDVDILDDGWTVVTADRRLSSHWEHTIAIFADHIEVLTEDQEEGKKEN
ncbi:MAG: type I methionyl aminopeptidase [Spirochaetaceae bacterium]|jgi:methionyl aminopeptidase|nr:type I methionyl aminopeptidase [Spirochaetaceae bacterium]